MEMLVTQGLSTMRVGVYEGATFYLTNLFLEDEDGDCMGEVLSSLPNQEMVL